MNIKAGFGGYINNSLFMTELDLNIDEYYWRKLHELLRIYPIKNGLCRIGNHGDGGYVMANCMPGGIAYSFGINDDVSWDDDMANRNYDIYMYDHTIDGLPMQREQFHFHKCGIDSKVDDNPLSGPKNTLAHFIQINGHESHSNMILKLDVEGAEWDVLANIEEKTLRHFSQIVLEYHGLVSNSGKIAQDKLLPSLEKINTTHRLIHLHGNNMGPYIKWGNKLFPDALEATYVRRGLPYILWSEEQVTLPVALDEANDPYRKDLILGNWNEPFDSMQT